MYMCVKPSIKPRICSIENTGLGITRVSRSIIGNRDHSLQPCNYARTKSTCMIKHAHPYSCVNLLCIRGCIHKTIIEQSLHVHVRSLASCFPVIILHVGSPVSMASLTMAWPLSSAASHGIDMPRGGITNTSPGTRSSLATPSSSEEGRERMRQT